MRRLINFTLLLGALLLTAAFLPASEAGAVVSQTAVLYDGREGGTPDEQGLSFFALGASSRQIYVGGVTALDTTADMSNQAGYISREPLSLDRVRGYKLHFTVQLLAEEHEGRHRSGLSILLLSDDLRGVELAFWEDEIWVQEGGSGADLFTHAEGVTFDTTADLGAFELNVMGDAYTLSTGGATLLNGSLRDYSAFDGFPDPYETPGMLFLGDNTRRASAETAIAFVAVETSSTPPGSAPDRLPVGGIPAGPLPAVTTPAPPPSTATATSTPQPTPAATPWPAKPLETQWPVDRYADWLPCLKGVR